jgi:Predicted transcriptional regulators
MEIRIFDYPYVKSTSMITPPEVFKNLADETRARATLLIASLGELCVCELMCALDDSQPKISRHLAQLRSSGLLLDRRQGQWVYYRLNPNLPTWVHDMLQVTLQANATWLQANTARLQHMADRPVRAAACC